MFRSVQSQRLTKKALLFVIVFIFIPMLLIFWFASNRASLSIKMQVGKALSELNKQNLATMDRVMDSVDQKLVTILSSDLMQKWKDDSTLNVEQRVQKYIATEKLLGNYSTSVKYSLFVLTKRPTNYYFAPSTDVSGSGVFFVQDLKERTWLQKAAEANGRGLVENIDKFGFNVNSQKTIAYLRAVTDLSNSGDTISILVATEIESLLTSEMNSIKLPDHTREFLTDARGTVLVGSAPDELTFSIPDNGKELLPNVWITNSHMYVYHDSPLYANRLIYEIPLSSLLGSYNDVQEIIQITAICYFIVILFFLFYLGKSVLRPMVRLASLTRSYVPGKEMERYAEEDRKDEIGISYRYFYLMTERLNQLVKEKYIMEIKQKESELILMHSQITPHLLYNTLDSVYWYGIRGGVPEVADMVRDLSTMLRIGLSRGKEIITIREELNHVEAYLQLQEKRYNQSFHFHIHVEEGIEGYLLPKVIIQPLVENSILHGIGKMDGEGEVWIGIQVSEGKLLISVEDNGFRPLDLEKIHSLLSGTADPDKGFGIRNVHKRIQLRFGNGYGLTYSAREEGGTKVLIRLPVIRSEDEIAAYTE
ncbi:sensor histidine kinase [Paenibacillus sp. N3.4]|uniref:cache domain-containing sensor histidine kinase n=1 Tax=Paenibacillus sp. N3.4 TaxID=2603222 RepID=UPI0011C84000|nr:sensor histidine kinase [Paenibacillus sp. N3.4]TXK84557.1 sensor histidine kinase [Paenibacillus sp. N3.4]